MCTVGKFYYLHEGSHLTFSWIKTKSLGRRCAQEGKTLGRTDHLLGIKELTKTWSQYQTDTLGLDLDAGQLLEDFTERLNANLAAADVMLASKEQLTSFQEKEVQAWRKKADTLSKNHSEKQRHQIMLAEFCGLRPRSSQRATKLTEEEELERLLWAWRIWDKTCQVVARENPEELIHWVANPDEFSEWANICETEISLGDQTPAWLRIEPGKLLSNVAKLKEAREKGALRQKRRKLEKKRMKAQEELEELRVHM
jgi:hypothetical protein